MSFTVHRFSDVKDKEALLALWNSNHKEHLGRAYEWAYENNPAGKAMGFLARSDEDHACIGCSAAYPRRFSFLDTSLRGLIARDFLVDEKHRILGPALALMRELTSAVEEKGVDFIYAYPNAKAEPVMKRAGFTCLGSWTKMVKPMGITRRLRNRRIPWRLARVISRVCATALRLRDTETWFWSRGGFIFEEITTFDERLDTLWKESKSRFQVMGERTSEHCTWKFLKCPSTQFTVFAMFSPDRAVLKGYIASCIDENAVDIRDFVLPRDEKATRILLAHFLRHVRKMSPDSVVVAFLENEGLRNLFRRYGFRERPAKRRVYCCFSRNTLKSFPGLKEARNWLLLGSDVHY